MPWHVEKVVERIVCAEKLSKRRPGVAVECVVEISRVSRAAHSARHASRKTFFAILIEDVPLLLVTEHLVGFGNLLELFLGSRRFVLIWVIFKRHLAVGLFDLILGGTLLDAQNLVVVFPHP